MKEIKFGKKYDPKDFKSDIGKWRGNKFRIGQAASLWEDKGRFYLGYLGCPGSRFVSREVVEEIQKDEFEKAIKGELDWSYFKAKYVTC